MDIYESKLIDVFNENQLINNSDIIVNELSLPKEINAADKARYTDIIIRANKVLEDNGGSKETRTETTITNIILDALKFLVGVYASGISGVKINAATPNALKINMKVNTAQGKKTLRFNPLKYILGFVIDRLVNKLFEIVVAPARRASMINNYRKMVDSLQKIKRTCKDDSVEKKCDRLIERINKEILKISNQKGDKNMNTIEEMLQDEDFGLSFAESSDDSLNEAESIIEDTLQELEEACGSCNKSVKKETADDEDGEDDIDVDPEDESAEIENESSVIDIEDDFEF
jgi:hypothetical protein|uniref:Uncharacterized protein n=1 Tax=Myoviridae sp. ctcyQ27 TaxID=2825139 RepID=A0A8S5UFF9_9CAUD|nr:MAG TPA: hypothetical protein [Myoviridae sp. ctcyQ27]